ncbi:hypothetical protein [Alicyclobacillus macrosporangiidus]|uniref:hypothetical protein n=1 Tax=Alicyclobacillus macrosporangiidus TaxID=392015 RepID=UPI000495CB60|nr:hypothetical protein [Alicyclobacillus macrosporangiidus]
MPMQHLRTVGTETETCVDRWVNGRMEDCGGGGKVLMDARQGGSSLPCVECGADIRTQRPGAVYTCDRCGGQSE